MTLYGTTVVILSDLRDIGAGLSGNLKKICHPLIADWSLQQIIEQRLCLHTVA